MKKVFLSLAVLFSVALVSCGGGDKSAADSGNVTVVEENVTVVDSNAPAADSNAPVADSNAPAADSAAQK